jgi:hypothetical protein
MSVPLGAFHLKGSQTPTKSTRWGEDAVSAPGAGAVDGVDETFVVFSGRIFRYRRGDQTARTAVEAHARSVGVPESELDWPV